MLLQKPGPFCRIKQFISHRRRNSSLEEYQGNLESNFTNKKSSTSKLQTSRLSWVSQNSPTETPPLRRASSTATTRSRPSPQIHSTAHSSASSLCSCECAANPPPSTNSLSSPAPTRIEPRTEILYLPSVSTTSSGDAKTWRLIFPEKPPSSSEEATRDSGETIARSSTFNLLEALTIDPADSDRTPTQSARNSGESDMESLEDNVEQLIRETDEAFQAVGTALADAKAATQGWRKEPVPEPVTRNVAVYRGASRKDARASALPAKSAITRTKSVAKTKRKGFHRKKNLLSPVRNAHTPPVSTQPRWTLIDVTANVVDIFSGMMFKIEADEMLTPDRLHRLKQDEKAEIERRISVESACSVETDGSTPTEPFHLESLSSRLAAVALKDEVTPPLASPILLTPAIPQRRRIPARKGLKAAKAKITVSDSGTDFQGLKFPSPPRIPNRSNARHPPPPPLPTIPEVSPLSFTPPQLLYGKSKDRQFSFESIQPPPDYILLPSTSWTLTFPLMKHEPIRIERKEKELLPEDEVLDWTAFQMAISGTMDEIGVDERDDIEWAADEEEVDEILDWWTGYKFPGYGQMIQEGPSPRKKAADVAMETHKSIPRSDCGTDKIVVEGTMQGGALKWARKGYAESMPPSPMLEFVPPTPTKKDVVIPMGFNLGHDLGDFLDWETNYVRKYFVND